MTEHEVGGPFFEDLSVGQVFDSAPAITLTSGLSAMHQAIVGSRLALVLSEPLALTIAGRAPLVDPALVWDIAIGHSSLVTQRVRANLFYRGLVLHRLPTVGNTLATVTTIAALKQNRVRDDRLATGLTVLHIVTTDQDGVTILDFHRCAMIPLRDPSIDTGHHRALAMAAPDDVADDDLLLGVEGWTLPDAQAAPVAVGDRLRVTGADVVSASPELARLTLNLAAVHHDATVAGGRRLVYGGQTIALALLQATRALPGLLTVLAWHSCDHLAPVHEGDRLTSVFDVQRVEPRSGGGQVLHLRSLVTAVDEITGASSDVLDWRFVVLHQ